MANRLTQITKVLVNQTVSQTEENKKTKKLQIATEPYPMRREHINEVAELFTKNFLSNNPVWKSFDLDNKQVYKFFVNEVKLHLDSEQKLRKEINPNFQFNMIFIHDGKVISAGLDFQLHEYLKITNSPGQSQTLKHFQVLESYGKKLFDSIKLQEHQKGKHIYGSFLVVDQDVSDEVKKVFRNKALLHTYKGFIDQGFKSLILRTSNVRSEQIYLAMGAKIMSEVSFELKNHKFQLKLLKLEFENPIFRKLVGL